MMIQRMRHNRLFKMIAVRVAFAFLINTTFQGISYADIFHAKHSALATNSLGDEIYTQEEYDHMSETLADIASVYFEDEDIGGDLDLTFTALQEWVQRVQGIVDSVRRDGNTFIFTLAEGYGAFGPRDIPVTFTLFSLPQEPASEWADFDDGDVPFLQDVAGTVAEIGADRSITDIARSMPTDNIPGLAGSDNKGATLNSRLRLCAERKIKKARGSEAGRVKYEEVTPVYNELLARLHIKRGRRGRRATPPPGSLHTVFDALLRARQPLTIAAIAERTGASEGNVRRDLGTLGQRGRFRIVDSQGEADDRVFFPTDDARRVGWAILDNAFGPLGASRSPSDLDRAQQAVEQELARIAQEITLRVTYRDVLEQLAAGPVTATDMTEMWQGMQEGEAGRVLETLREAFRIADYDEETDTYTLRDAARQELDRLLSVLGRLTAAASWAEINSFRTEIAGVISSAVDITADLREGETGLQLGDRIVFSSGMELVVNSVGESEVQFVPFVNWDRYDDINYPDRMETTTVMAEVLEAGATVYRVDPSDNIVQTSVDVIAGGFGEHELFDFMIEDVDVGRRNLFGIMDREGSVRAIGPELVAGGVGPHIQRELEQGEFFGFGMTVVGERRGRIDRPYCQLDDVQHSPGENVPAVAVQRLATAMVEVESRYRQEKQRHVGLGPDAARLAQAVVTILRDNSPQTQGEVLVALYQDFDAETAQIDADTAAECLEIVGEYQAAEESAESAEALHRCRMHLAISRVIEVIRSRGIISDDDRDSLLLRYIQEACRELVGTDNAILALRRTAASGEPEPGTAGPDVGTEDGTQPHEGSPAEVLRGVTKKAGKVYTGVREIAREVGIAESTAEDDLRTLAYAGLLDRRKERGEPAEYRLAREISAQERRRAQAYLDWLFDRKNPQNRGNVSRYRSGEPRQALIATLRTMRRPSGMVEEVETDTPFKVYVVADPLFPLVSGEAKVTTGLAVTDPRGPDFKDNGEPALQRLNVAAAHEFLGAAELLGPVAQGNAFFLKASFVSGPRNYGIKVGRNPKSIKWNRTREEVVKCEMWHETLHLALNRRLKAANKWEGIARAIAQSENAYVMRCRREIEETSRLTVGSVGNAIETVPHMLSTYRDSRRIRKAIGDTFPPRIARAIEEVWQETRPKPRVVKEVIKKAEKLRVHRTKPEYLARLGEMTVREQIEVAERRRVAAYSDESRPRSIARFLRDHAETVFAFERDNAKAKGHRLGKRIGELREALEGTLEACGAAGVLGKLNECVIGEEDRTPRLQICVIGNDEELPRAPDVEEEEQAARICGYVSSEAVTVIVRRRDLSDTAGIVGKFCRAIRARSSLAAKRLREADLGTGGFFAAAGLGVLVGRMQFEFEGMRLEELVRGHIEDGRDIREEQLVREFAALDFDRELSPLNQDRIVLRQAAATQAIDSAIDEPPSAEPGSLADAEGEEDFPTGSYYTVFNLLWQYGPLTKEEMLERLREMGPGLDLASALDKDLAMLGPGRGREGENFNLITHEWNREKGANEYRLTDEAVQVAPAVAPRLRSAKATRSGEELRFALIMVHEELRAFRETTLPVQYALNMSALRARWVEGASEEELGPLALEMRRGELKEEDIDALEARVDAMAADMGIPRVRAYVRALQETQQATPEQLSDDQRAILAAAAAQCPDLDFDPQEIIFCSNGLIKFLLNLYEYHDACTVYLAEGEDAAQVAILHVSSEEAPPVYRMVMDTHALIHERMHKQHYRGRVRIHQEEPRLASLYNALDEGVNEMRAAKETVVIFARPDMSERLGGEELPTEQGLLHASGYHSHVLLTQHILDMGGAAANTAIEEFVNGGNPNPLRDLLGESVFDTVVEIFNMKVPETGISAIYERIRAGLVGQVLTLAPAQRENGMEVAAALLRGMSEVLSDPQLEEQHHDAVTALTEIGHRPKLRIDLGIFINIIKTGTITNRERVRNFCREYVLLIAGKFNKALAALEAEPSGPTAAGDDGSLETFAPRGVTKPIKYAELEGSFIDELEVRGNLGRGRGRRFRRRGGSSGDLAKLLNDSLDGLEGIAADAADLKRYLSSILGRPDNMSFPIRVRVSKKLRENSARYFAPQKRDPQKGEVIIILSENYARQLLRDQKAHPDATRLILAERLFHELGHRNRGGSRQEEYFRIVKDLRLHQIMRKTGRQAGITKYLNGLSPFGSGRPDAQLFHSGYYFEKFIQGRLMPVADNPTLLTIRINAYLDRNYPESIGEDEVMMMAAHEQPEGEEDGAIEGQTGEGERQRFEELLVGKTPGAADFEAAKAQWSLRPGRTRYHADEYATCDLGHPIRWAFVIACGEETIVLGPRDIVTLGFETAEHTVAGMQAAKLEEMRQYQQRLQTLRKYRNAIQWVADEGALLDELIPRLDRSRGIGDAQFEGIGNLYKRLQEAFSTLDYDEDRLLEVQAVCSRLRNIGFVALPLGPHENDALTRLTQDEVDDLPTTVEARIINDLYHRFADIQNFLRTLGIQWHSKVRRKAVTDQDLSRVTPAWQAGMRIVTAFYFDDISSGRIAGIADFGAGRSTVWQILGMKGLPNEGVIDIDNNPDVHAIAPNPNKHLCSVADTEAMSEAIPAESCQLVVSIFVFDLLPPPRAQGCLLAGKPRASAGRGRRPHRTIGCKHSG